LTTDGCKTFASTIKHSSCVGQEASLLFCDAQGNVSSAKARAGGEIDCEDQFLVFDANTNCLTRKTVGDAFLECFSAPPTEISCDSLLPATGLLCTDEFAFCDGTSLMRAPLGTSSAIAEDSTFLVCQGGALELAPLQPTAALLCDAGFIVAQDGQVQVAPLGTSTNLIAGDELIACQDNNLNRVLVTADSVACEARFLVTQNGQLTLARVDATDGIPCTAAFLYCDGTSIVRAPLTDASCTVLDCETDSVLVCAGGIAATKRLDYFAPAACNGTIANLQPASSDTYTITLGELPLVGSCPYRFKLLLSGATDADDFAVQVATPMVGNLTYVFPNVGITSQVFQSYWIIEGTVATISADPNADCDFGQLSLLVTITVAAQAEVFNLEFGLSAEPVHPGVCNATLP
jgi:hypothetical protein